MAQLEDDVESKETPVDVVNVAPSRRTEIVYEDRETANDDRSNVAPSSEDFGDRTEKSEIDDEEGRKINKTTVSIFEDERVKSEENLATKTSARVYKPDQSCGKVREMPEDSKRSKENSIQELRRNWEKHTRGDQDTDAKTIHTAHSAKITINLSKAIRTGNDVVDGTQEARRQQCVSKRAKDIEHLVNFFNCKNAENSTKEMIKSRSVTETSAMKKSEKSANEYNGYASDGNCSEDSGHISNENEVEWKDTMESQSQRGTGDFKGQQYFDRIRQDDDDDAKMFDATIVRGSPECPEKKEVVISPESPLMSSGASSIDSSCRDDRCPENGRQVRVDYGCGH